MLAAAFSPVSAPWFWRTYQVPPANRAQMTSREIESIFASRIYEEREGKSQNAINARFI